MDSSLAIPPLSKSILEGLSIQSRTCIQRLRAHQVEDVDLSGQSRLAAVLVLLYEQAHELRVLLTTRARTLRAHPGETALPGGKVDEADESILATAFREAYEEVGLPLNHPAVHLVCVMRPFLSNRKVVVRPVVALLTDPSVLDHLKANEDEVACIFDHPLNALLDPGIVSRKPMAEKGSADWPYEVDYHSTDDRVLPFLGNATYRMHRFRSSASPVKGLTAEILMTVAEVAYDKQPTFERYASRQMTSFAAVLRALEAAEASAPVVSGASTPIGISTGVSHPSS